MRADVSGSQRMQKLRMLTVRSQVKVLNADPNLVCTQRREAFETCWSLRQWDRIFFGEK
jgi:hypothetical protein